MSGASLVPCVHTENNRAGVTPAGPGRCGCGSLSLREGCSVPSPDPAPGQSWSRPPEPVPAPRSGPGLPAAVLVLDDSVNGEARWDERV